MDYGEQEHLKKEVGGEITGTQGRFERVERYLWPPEERYGWNCGGCAEGKWVKPVFNRLNFISPSSNIRTLSCPPHHTHFYSPPAKPITSSPRDHLTCHQPELPAYHTYSGEKRDGEAQTAEPNVISPRVLKACASQLRGVLHHLSNPSLHLRESQCYVQWSTEDWFIALWGGVRWTTCSWIWPKQMSWWGGGLWQKQIPILPCLHWWDWCRNSHIL